MDDNDLPFIRRAIDVSRACKSESDRVSPAVGAVVVRQGLLLADAFRGELSPGQHAEFTVLETKLADDVVAGATAYTTLEPCTTRNHPKIQCARRLIDRKVARVVIGMLDPNPAIRGNGVRLLRQHNIATELFPADLAAEVEDLNRHFTRAIEAAAATPLAAATVRENQSSDASAVDSFVLLMTPEGRPLFCESTRIEVGDEVRLRLLAKDPATSAALAGLRERRGRPVPIAFRLTAMLARVKSVLQTVEHGAEVWDLLLEENSGDYFDTLQQEMGFGSLSADDLADMRARRILLNEVARRPGASTADPAMRINDAAFELFLSGFNTPISVTSSPLPGLHAAVTDRQLFLAAARLMCVLWLRLSKAVERVLQLDLQIDGVMLHVSFVGERERDSRNAPPHRIEIDGVCDLQGTSPAINEDDEPEVLDLRVAVDEAFARVSKAIVDIAELNKHDAEASRRWADRCTHAMKTDRGNSRARHGLVGEKAREFGHFARDLGRLVREFRLATDEFFQSVERMIEVQIKSGVSTRAEMLNGLQSLAVVDTAARACGQQFSRNASLMDSLKAPTREFKQQKRHATAQVVQLIAAIDAWLERSEGIRERIRARFPQ